MCLWGWRGKHNGISLRKQCVLGIKTRNDTGLICDVMYECFTCNSKICRGKQFGEHIDAIAVGEFGEGILGWVAV